MYRATPNPSSCAKCAALAVAAAAAAAATWASRGVLRRFFAWRDLEARCAGLSSRRQDPLPGLLVVLLGAIPTLSLAARPGAQAPAPAPSACDVLLSCFFQAFLFGAGILATYALPGLPSFRRGRAPSPAALFPEARRAPEPLPSACVHGVLLGVVALVVTHALVLLSCLLSRRMGLAPDVQPVVGRLAATGTPFAVKAILVAQGVFAGPVLEELFFRRTFLPALAAATGDMGRAIFYSSALFALLHGSFTAAIPLAVFSVFCSLALLATGRVVVPVIMHAMFNASGMAMIMMAARG